ncbi:DUF2892 domain-containing protein [candidate division FCPU426 bacterium]|nr:DUF2892 domain-containing protein [candidate division FCPU426 bacterium]
MKRNIGVLDKGIRFFAGTVCVLVGFTREPRSAVNAFLLILAAYLFLTAFSGVCSIYSALGINTRKKE